MAATKAAVDAGVDLESMDPIDVIRAGPLCMAEGARLKDAFVYPETMPAWFTEADLDFYTGEFERSGFGGPLSFYHNIDNDWHDLADQQGKPLTRRLCSSAASMTSAPSGARRPSSVRTKSCRTTAAPT